MKPIFCGNFEYDAREGDLERLFRKYGKVERVDMKSGFAFIYMEDERDADDAIRARDRVEFGRRGRRLRVEWTKNDRGGGGGRRSEGSRRSSNMKPSKTLFVINFDAQNTRTRDLERHFEPYGKIVSVRIRKNFAFVQYDSLEDSTRALDATNMSKLLDRVISVEFAVKDDDVRGNGNSPDRHRDRSPDRRRRSVSPYRRERGSPDYGRGPSPGPYRKERGSPDYGRRRSPSPFKRDKPSPDYGRRERDENPYGRERVSSPKDGEIDRSRSRNRSHSPSKREKQSPKNDYASDRSPYGREEGSPRNERGDSPSPYRRERSRSPANGHGPSPGSMPESPTVRERYNSSRSPPAEE